MPLASLLSRVAPRLAGALVLALSAGWSAAPAQATSCASAIVVDGRLLIGTFPRADLPAGGDQVDAIQPACNDTNGDVEPDQRTRATRLPGLSATVAVRVGRELFVHPASPTAVRAHPLHRFLGSRRRPSRCTDVVTTLRGRLVRNANLNAFELRTAAITAVVVLLADTRVRGGLAYEPLLAGQQVEVAVQRSRAAGSGRENPRPWGDASDAFPAVSVSGPPTTGAPETLTGATAP